MNCSGLRHVDAPAPSILHNIAQPTTSFVGRAADVEKIINLLSRTECRLVTLIGPGGSGKSRLALRVAEELAITQTERAAMLCPDGIIWIPLQSVANPDQIVSAIVKALNWQAYAGTDPVNELLYYLQNKRLLLILDNFEHLLIERPLVQTLLHGAPGLKVLVTSRVLLNLTDEWLFRVEGLSYPTAASDAAYGDYDAPRLFAERAQRMRHDFALATEWEHVARICRSVEGMPLALELAATWLRNMPCAEIASEIEHGLAILQSDQLGVPDRHRTMHAVFDQSWVLLTEAEQVSFMSTSVFRGGFLRDAAEQVVDVTSSVLAALVDKSMLRLTAEGRYHIHELHRQYAAERLDQAPDLRDTVRDRHAALYLKLLIHPELEFVDDRGKALLDALEADVENVFVGWDWAVAQGWMVTLRQAVVGLYWFAWLKSRHREGERAMRAALKALRIRHASNEDRLAYAVILREHGAMGNWLGVTDESKAELVESVAILREVPEAGRELGIALGALGWALVLESDYQAAEPMLLEAVALDQEHKRYVQLGFLYSLLGKIAQKHSAYPASEQWHRRALELGHKVGDHRTITNALCDLAQLAIDRGRYTDAHELLVDALAMAEAHDLAAFRESALLCLGQLASIRGDYAHADDYLQQSVSVARAWGKRPTIAATLMQQARVLTRLGDFALAHQLLQEASGIIEGMRDAMVQNKLCEARGYLALHMADYAGARRFYLESLAHFHHAGDRPRFAQACCVLGAIALREAAHTEVTSYVVDALRSALAIGLDPLLLDSLMVATELLVAEGDVTAATQVAAIVQEHPAASAATRQRAQRVLAAAREVATVATQGITLDTGADSGLVAIAEQVLAAFAQRLKQRDHAMLPDHAPLIEPLSDRELQVLRRAASGMSNRQISRELYLSVSTVKSHLHHINQKLAVQTRTQAIARARELRYL